MNRPTDFFAGISGAELPYPKFEIAPGVLVRQVYAHGMTPYLLAFHRPESERSHHPGPWKATEQQRGYDILFEIKVEAGKAPQGLDDINTCWFTLALLRMKSNAAIRCPFIGDGSFELDSAENKEVRFWPIEMKPGQLATSNGKSHTLLADDLIWVRQHFTKAASLFAKPEFNRAFQTFDSIIWAHSAGAAIVMLWAAIETIMRPGSQAVTKTLAQSIAAYLTPERKSIQSLFNKIKDLYETRGGAVHNSAWIDSEELQSSHDLAKQVIMKTIEEGSMPDTPTLLTVWKVHTGKSATD